MSARAGFSLIEVLVSVVVFALLGAMATGLLNSSLAARDLNTSSGDRAAMIDRARVLMREDFGQLVNRPARQIDGRAGSIAFAGASSGIASPDAAADETVLIAFTRAGRPNPGGVQPRGSLQYVEYVRHDDRLIRRSWSYPDRAAATPARDFVLLDGVTGIELGFLRLNSWAGSALSARSEGGTPDLPRAVRLRTEMRDGRDLEFILLTPEMPS